MEDLLKTGKAKSIGVSNFSQKKLEEEILPFATVVPAVDQVWCLFFLFFPFAEVCARELMGSYFFFCVVC